MAIETTTATSVTPTSSTEMLGLMDRASTTAGAYGEAAPANPITVAPLTGTSFWYAVQALAAYAPANQETFQGEFCGIRP